MIAGQYLSVYLPAAVTNVAQGKAASQSSNNFGAGIASEAVDGDTNGNYFAGSVTQTGFDTNAWWQVDLGASYPIDTIRLWNRTDCCANRLSNFYVFVSGTSLTGRSLTNILADSTVWKYQVTGQAPTTMNIPANVSGRFVRVQLAGTNYLSLAEVQVFAGSLTPTWTFCANENGTCSFTGTRQVRYGANNVFTYKVLTNGTACTNAVFGDPLVGVVKRCEILK